MGNARNTCFRSQQFSRIPGPVHKEILLVVLPTPVPALRFCPLPCEDSGVHQTLRGGLGLERFHPQSKQEKQGARSSSRRLFRAVKVLQTGRVPEASNWSTGTCARLCWPQSDRPSRLPMALPSWLPFLASGGGKAPAALCCYALSLCPFTSSVSSMAQQPPSTSLPTQRKLKSTWTPRQSAMCLPPTTPGRDVAGHTKGRGANQLERPGRERGRGLLQGKDLAALRITARL